MAILMVDKHISLDNSPPVNNIYTYSKNLIWNTKPEFSHGIFLSYADSTPSAMTFTAAAATDLITAASHGCGLGLVGRMTTTGTLPAGLSLATDYFVIPVATNTFRVATSLANALSGAYVDITDTGTGTHTFTPTTASGLSLQLSWSMDGGVTFVNKFQMDGLYEWTEGALTPSTAATKWYDFHSHRHMNAIKLAISVTAGQITLTGKICASR